MAADYTFGGELEFEILSRSFATDLEMETIQREILATRTEWTVRETQLIEEIAILLSCTASVKSVGKRLSPPISVVKLIAGVTHRPAWADLFTWRIQIPHKLIIAWNAAWITGQDIYAAPPEQLPTSSLTDEQKADPFLVKSE